MNQQQREPYIHRHIHYHYHYDVNEPPMEIRDQDSHTRIRSPKNKNYSGQYDSWKNHINPQVTRLYEEMSETSSSQDSPNPRVSSYINRQSVQDSNLFHPSTSQFPQFSQSRQRLLNNIQEYQEYLRKRSPSNIHIPTAVSFIQSQYPQNQQKRHFLNLQQNQREKKTLDDFIRKKADSKIFNSYQSTTANNQKNQNQRDSQFYHMRKSQPQFNPVTKSQIRNPKRHFAVSNTRMGFSHIDTPQNEQKDLNETHNFSLFQKQVNQESFREGNKNSWPKYYPSDESSQMKNSQENSNYRYELMKEECEYLRNKFIEHIETIHKIKF